MIKPLVWETLNQYAYEARCLGGKYVVYQSNSDDYWYARFDNWYDGCDMIFTNLETAKNYCQEQWEYSLIPYLTSP